MISDLGESIQKLIALYEGERDRRRRLEAELAEKTSEADDLRKQITELTRKVNNRELAQAFTAQADNAAARDKIEKMIKEIDRCISLLEQ